MRRWSWLLCWYLAGSACAPPLPRFPSDLSRLDVQAPVEIRLVDLYENRSHEPYAPLVSPSGVTVSGKHEVFFADAGTGLVHRFGKGGAFLGTLDDADGDLVPVDLVAHGFHVFALDGASRWVIRFTDEGVFRERAFFAGEFAEGMEPVAMDVDREGRFALADAANHRIVVTGPFFQPEFVVGSYGSFEGQLTEPRGVAFGLDGLLYVAESGNRRVQVFDRTGLAVGSTLSMGGVNDQFVAPRGLAADRHGNIYVADEARGVVVVLAPDLTPLVELGGDPLAEDELRRPVDCAVGSDDRLYVVDRGRRALLVFQILFP